MIVLRIIAPLTRDTRKLCWVAEGPNQGRSALEELIEGGKIASVVDRTCQLEEGPEALRCFGEGRQKGRIAIAVLKRPADGNLNARVANGWER